jgi:hypothetical protein
MMRRRNFDFRTDADAVDDRHPHEIGQARLRERRIRRARRRREGHHVLQTRRAQRRPALHEDVRAELHRFEEFRENAR